MSALVLDFAVPVLGASAGSCSWKAQSRDLYGDTGAVNLPSIGRDVLDVWDSYPIAGKGSKLSHGSEQSSDVSARCAAGIVAGDGAGFPSLDSIKNNRHKPTVQSFENRPVGRGSWCGKWSLRGLNPTTGRPCTRRMNCKAWSCSYCGPRRARTARQAIRAHAEGLGLRYFLTLTLDPSKIEFMENRDFAVPYMRQIWNKFREYLRREFGCPPSFIVVLEFTKSGAPHLHVLLDRYIDQKWISRTWDSLGGGRICFIKQVKVVHVARYLSKYLTKELFLSAPKGTRRITTSRSIKLFPKWIGQHTEQELVRHSVWQLMSEQRVTRAFTAANPILFEKTSLLVDYDEEKFLKSFELLEESFL